MIIWLYFLFGMRDTKDYFKPVRVEVKMVQRIGNENSSYVYYE